MTPSPHPDEHQAQAALDTLFSGGTLGEEEAEALFARLVAGELEPPVIGALLMALRLKGESAAELTGAARALRDAAAPFPRPDYLFADSCGTGGDGSGTINVSTAAAFVAAAAGLPVAKHGNRSVTSRCGSADVLEQLGARLDLTAEQSRRVLDESGFCFLFAPAYHPGMRHAAAARKALKVRTIMNMLGPCLNPAAPPVQLLGVADPALLQPIAQTLQALGTAEALVVHGSGLDEVALHGDTQAVRLSEGIIEPVTLRPEDAGLARTPLSAIGGGMPEENAERLKALLDGHGEDAETAIVALNAGALLMTARIAPTLRDGVARAAELIRGGDAGRRLALFVEASHA